MFEGLDAKTKKEAILALNFQKKKDEVMNILVKYAAKIDSEIQVFEDTDFASICTKKIVFVNLEEFFIESEEIAIHKKIDKENGLFIDISYGLFAFLHEIGHIKTINKYKDPIKALENYSREVSEILHEEISTYDMLKVYKTLTLERDADKYAIKHLERNYKELKELDKKILAVIS